MVTAHTPKDNPGTYKTDTGSQCRCQKQAQNNLCFCTPQNNPYFCTHRNFSLFSCFLDCQESVQSIHIGFSTGNDNVRVGTTPGITYTIALNPDKHLTDSINTFRNRFHGELSEFVGHLDYSINGFVSSIH